MTTSQLTLDTVHPTWLTCIEEALKTLESGYLESILNATECLPHKHQLFNAFSIPLGNIRYVLIGESPYPRLESANGYAFWDASVNELWSEKGMSKRVNRATSLRNILKMLLIADGLLDIHSPTQANIAKINKNHLVESNNELFQNFLDRGFLLLNASLVLQPQNKVRDARAWFPFMRYILLNCLKNNSPKIKLLLFGQIAQPIVQIFSNEDLDMLITEHPYNLSFITNKAVLDFFRPLKLLQKKSF